MTCCDNNSGNFSLRHGLVLNRQCILIAEITILINWEIGKLSFILHFVRLAKRYLNKSIDTLLL